MQITIPGGRVRPVAAGLALASVAAVTGYVLLDGPALPKALTSITSGCGGQGTAPLAAAANPPAAHLLSAVGRDHRRYRSTWTAPRPAGSPSATASPGGTASPTATASPGGTASSGGTAAPSGTASAAGTAAPGGMASAGATAAPSGMAPAAGTPGVSATPSCDPAAGQATQAAQPADPNPDCTLTVPANPLSASGLATPYLLTATDRAKGGCHEADTAQSAFVQATIVDPATGRLSVFAPLVIDRGSRPLAAPKPPTLPKGAVVGLWFGFNGTNLTLRGDLAGGACVNGLAGSIFGQFADCNAAKFFTAANAAIKAGKLKIPALGKAKDGTPCPTTRSFQIIDQDQSDNVTSQYLADARGRIAQNTAANRAALKHTTAIANGSDNLLLDAFVDPAIGCKPFTAPDLGDNGAQASALGLNELQAAADQAAPSAIVPANDPMVLDGDQQSAAKLGLYRQAVDQTAAGSESPATYCKQMDALQPVFLARDKALLIAGQSPAADQASNLFTFMGMRLQQSFENLGCANFGLSNPVADLRTSNGVVTDVRFAAAKKAQPPRYRWRRHR